MSTVIAVPISEKMATLNELETVYNLENCFDMLEIISIDRYNEHCWHKFYENRR